MSAQQHADKRRPLWQPKRMSTRLSTSQAAHQYDKRRNGYTCDGLSSKTVELSPETVIVHLPGVRSARRSYGSGDNDTPRVELPSSHPLLSAVSQTTRDDLHTEGRPSSDEDDPRTNGTSCVGHGSHQHPAAVGGPNWSSGHYSRLAQGGPVCTTPGLCQAGGELRLTHLNGKAVQVLEGFELVGAKSPRMPGMTLVAAVDKRFLPDEKNNVTMLGFSGNCIGCGAKGFRYFTEFSYHINLKLGTQPKKQKHLKYYITREASGRICKGPSIPWRVEAGRKRTFPQSGPFIPPPYTVTDTEVLGEISETRAKSALNPSHFTPHCTSESPSDRDIPLSHLSNQSTLESTVHQVPPVKRRRWQSEDSDTHTSADDSHPSDAHSAPQTFAAASCDAGELPPDLWLTTACSVRPVMLLCHHAIPKIPCSVEDIIISDLLVGCFDPPLVSDHHNQFGSMTGVYSKRDHLSAASTECPGQVGRSHYSGVPCLTTQMAVLLTVQYLAQFVDDDRICREDVESLLQDARLELTASVQHQAHLLAQSNAVTHVQLPVLASLTAATSKGRVKVVCSPVSLDNAILRALKFILEIHRHNQSKFPKVPVPDFIFILATSQKKAPEFCLLVTSASQAKYLSEAMVGHPVGPRITDNLSKLEQLFRLSSDALEQLIASYEAMGQGQLMFFPFNGFARMKVMADEAVRLEPRAINAAYQHHDGSAQVLFASQLLMAKQLLAQVCSISENVNSLDLNSFIVVDLAIVVPPLSTLCNQTVKRLWKSRLLSDLELESADGTASFHSATKYVIKHDGNDETREQLLKLLEKVQKQPKVLFVIILDQAQFYASPQGAVDLPYYKEFQEARNVVMLFVTAVPYLFQTNCSFIDPNNEVYWSDVRSETDGGSLVSLESSQDNPETNEGTYFGMKEYCESIKWTHQFPLVRQDDAFEKMALRTSRTTDDVNLSVLRCYLLIRHYCAAIMWSAGIKPAEPHCTLKTIQIMREVIESPVHNADGSGAMLVIRIPCVELANVAFESLKNTRDRLGFQFRFAIIHNSGASELEIEEYFLRRLRLWKEQRGTKEQRGRNQGKCFASWSPKCFEDLHDLPCIIIMSGRERPGDTFPRSLKYIDLRLIDRGFVYRSSLELEFSAIACYIGAGTGSRSVEGSEANAQQPVENKDSSNASGAGGTTCKTSHYSSNYPLPVILVSRSVFKAFQSDFYGYPKHLLLPTTSQTRWAGLGRPPVVTSNPRHQSLYYREWTEPKPKQFLGPQYNPAQSVITTRSASGVVISPDITDVVEEDGMSAVESLAGSNKLTSGAGTSDGEDSSNEDTKSCTENGAASKRGTGDQNTPAVNSRQEHQSVIGPTLLRRLNNMTAYSKPTADGEATSIDSATDNTDINPDLYHPRSILFSGSPQVGKTLAYLHFVRLLHRTVQKLQCVDVYNENLCSSVENLSQTKPEVSGKEEEKIAWPVHATVSNLPFNCALREHRYTNISKLRAHSSTGSAMPEQDVTHKLSIKGSNDRPTCSLMLSSWVAYDYYHHCDSCKHYREGMGASTSLCHVFTLGSGDKLQFVIPPTCQQNFTFMEDKRLRSLQLPLVLTGGPGEIVRLLKTEPGDKEATRAVKSPILVPSCGRHESGLLNLYHAMEGENHMLLVFVKNQEIALYHKAWPNHVIVGLPQSCDLQGLGAARYFIKQFATENWLAERERHGVNGKHGQDVWPFVFMMDDSCVLWQNLLKQTIKGESSPSKEPEGPFCVNTSLLKILQHLESTPDLMNYGMIGVRQYSSNISTPVWQGSFSHCPLHTAVMMNLRVLQHVHYDKQRYSREDLDLSVRVFANGILSCRFNHLVVAKKVIATGGHTAYKVQATRSSEESGRVELGEKLVTAPDREDAPYLSVPAYYLLERYLAQVGAVKLFPEAADKPDRPVLVLNCYVNLGPRICLEFASTSAVERGRKNVKQQVDRQDTRYGGLLLYFCDRSVSADFLAQFQFVPGSRLCLVCQDRNTLRQEVVRLDLEEHWRFRLRDEFQTANCPDEPALYFLTGTYE